MTTKIDIFLFVWELLPSWYECIKYVNIKQNGEKFDFKTIVLVER